MREAAHYFGIDHAMSRATLPMLDTLARELSARLQDFDRVSRHPDFELFESDLQATLQIEEELAVFGNVRNVDEYANQVVAEQVVLTMPQAADGLGFGRDRAETPLKLKQRVGDQFVRHWPAVVKALRQKNFESPK